MSASPLPLTPFEEYLLWEDRPAYPWSIFARMRFSGRVERAALEAAVRAIPRRHPLLASRVEARRGRRPHWVVQPGAEPSIDWTAGPTGGAMPAARRIDLRRETGLRVFVVEDRETCDVTLQAHHACCDGAGLEAVLNDLLIAYAMAAGERSPRLQLPPLDPERLARRGAYGLTAAKLLGLLPRQLVGLVGAGHFFLRSPQPLLPHSARPEDDPPAPGYPATRTHAFTREQSAALHGAARKLGVAANDLLARDVFLTLGEWRASEGAAGDDGWIRLMMPVDLRTADDRRLPAANKVGSVFIDRRGSELGGAAGLLAGISDEMRRIKERRLGLIFIYSLHLLRLVPGGLKSVARRDGCTVSAIFSNMGRILRRCPLPRREGRLAAAGLTLEEVEGIAPIRPYNCATFLSTEYAGRLTMTLHYDSRPISPAQADTLMEAFVRRVRATAATGA